MKSILKIPFCVATELSSLATELLAMAMELSSLAMNLLALAMELSSLAMKMLALAMESLSLAMKMLELAMKLSSLAMNLLALAMEFLAQAFLKFGWEFRYVNCVFISGAKFGIISTPKFLNTTPYFGEKNYAYTKAASLNSAS